MEDRSEQQCKLTLELLEKQFQSRSAFNDDQEVSSTPEVPIDEQNSAPIRKKYRPMPKSKRKEQDALDGIDTTRDDQVDESSIGNADTNSVTAQSEDEDSESSSTGSDDLIDMPLFLPEPVDINYAENEEGEVENEPFENADALEGVDVFKDQGMISYEYENDSEEEEQTEAEGEVDDTMNQESEESSSEVSESSEDLVDLEFNFTADELRQIRRKRRREERELKQRRFLMDQKRRELLTKAKKDRFYDKSRNIPGEIYFGDIQVPLHVLHSYGDDEDRKCAASTGQMKISSKKGFNQRTSLTHRIEMLKKYCRAAGIRCSKYKIKGAENDYQICNSMLEVLREHGLVGEPTLAKCRELKKSRERVVSDEDDLDPSVIINPNGRTLRSGTTIVLPEASPLGESVEM